MIYYKPFVSVKKVEKFMQQVQSAPEGIVVISSDTQIKDFT